MISSLSDLKRDYLDNENICCFLCDKNGIVRHRGCGLLMRYPHVFPKGRAFTEYYAAEENTDEILQELQKCGYSVTQPFQIYGASFFLCLFTVQDSGGKKEYILGKLEATRSEPAAADAPRYKAQLEEKNDELLSLIADGCRNLPKEAENTIRYSEALQRNRLLLRLLDQTVMVSPSGRGVYPEHICAALQKQLQLSQDTLPLRTVIRTATSGQRYYLDSNLLLEMLFALLTVYAIYTVERNLFLDLLEQDGMLCVQAVGSVATPDSDQLLIQNCLYEIIRRFSKRYGGTAVFLQNGKQLTVRVTFSPAVDDDTEDDGFFENDATDFSAIDRLLPLLRYADR